MQGKGIYTILLAIIAVLTLSVAVLVIFLFVTFSTRTTAATGAEATPASEAGPRQVAPDELLEIIVYSDKSGTGGEAPGSGLFNLKSTTEHPESYLMLDMTIKIDVGEKRELEVERTAMVNVTYITELRQAANLYFRNMTFEEASDPAAMQKAADELRDTFNAVLGTEAETQETIVYKVIFGKWLVQ